MCVFALGQYVVPVPKAVGPACMVPLEWLLPQKVTAAEDNKTCFVCLFFTTLPTKSTKKEEEKQFLITASRDFKLGKVHFKLIAM